MNQLEANLGGPYWAESMRAHWAVSDVGPIGPCPLWANSRPCWAVFNSIIFRFMLNSDINKELIKFKQVNLICLSEVGIKREEVSNLMLQSVFSKLFGKIIISGLISKYVLYLVKWVWHVKFLKIML